jgi:hypothetical protein
MKDNVVFAVQQLVYHASFHRDSGGGAMGSKPSGLSKIDGEPLPGPLLGLLLPLVDDELLLWSDFTISYNVSAPGLDFSAAHGDPMLRKHAFAKAIDLFSSILYFLTRFSISPCA